MLFRILHYDTLDSTNNKAKNLGAAEAEEGIVVFADYQTKGRGRLNRSWVSPRGKDLLFSILLRPRSLKANEIPIVTQVTARSICDVLEKELNLKSRIKKPNDILMDGKKVCGVLVEGSSSSSRVDYVVVGVGMNVNSGDGELVKNATSLYTVSGARQDRLRLLQLILSGFEEHYSKLLSKKGS